MSLLTLKVHSKTFCEYTHSNLAHCVCCLSSEEAGVDRRRDNNNAPIPAVGLEVWQRGLYRSIKPFGVDLLHQLEPPYRRILDRGPPNSSTVVDKGVQAAVGFDCLIHHELYAGKIPRIHCNSCRISPGFTDLSLDGIDR